MTLYKAKIKPKSNFITPLKGDTFFGHICWAISNLYGEEKLKSLLSTYDKAPFLIVSDGFATGHLPKPTLPTHLLKEDREFKKENKKKIWLSIEDLQNGNFDQAKTSKEVKMVLEVMSIVKNSINYKTFMTDDENFSPFSEKEIKINDRDVYFLVDEKLLTKDELLCVCKHIGELGYGKKAGTGKGQFDIDCLIPNPFSNTQSSTYMSLSPFCAYDTRASKSYYSSFTRFGKMGGSRAKGNVFKKPIMMADSGGVLVFQNKQNLLYIGKAITNISSAYQDVVHQGYSIAISIEDLYEQR